MPPAVQMKGHPEVEDSAAVKALRAVALAVTNNAAVDAAMALYDTHCARTVERLARQPLAAKALDFGARYLHTFARLCVCMYFIVRVRDSAAQRRGAVCGGAWPAGGGGWRR